MAMQFHTTDEVISAIQQGREIYLQAYADHQNAGPSEQFIETLHAWVMATAMLEELRALAYRQGF